MPEVANGLLTEVENKYKACVSYRADIDFDTNVTRWGNYYAGTSEETKKRKAKKKSAVMPPWAGTAVDHLWARYITALFMKKPFYAIFPLKETPEGIMSAEIAQDLVEYQLTRPSPFNNSTRYVQSMLAYGFGALKTGWDFNKNDVTLTNYNIKKVYWPPYLEDITQPDWIIFEYWKYYDDLVKESNAFEEKWGDQLYDNLDQLPPLSGMHLDEILEKHAKMGKKKPIRIWEYWDLEKKVVIAGEKVVILKTKNPLEPAFVPVILGSDIPKLEGITGTGEIEAIEDYIKQIATITNQRNDNIIQSLIPAWLQNSGVTILNEEELDDLSPGVRIQVRAPLNVPLNTVLMPIPPPMVTQQSYMEVAGNESNVRNRRGLYPYVLGEAPKQRETATAVQSLQAAGSVVSRAILMFMLRTSFVQIPSQIIAWDKKYLPDRTILAVSKTREAGIPVFRRVGKEDIQADLQFIETVSAIDPEGTKDTKRAQLMQAIQILGQIREVLPGVNFTVLAKWMLGTFDIPGLESVVTEAPRGQQSMMLPGGGRGGPPPQQAALQSLMGRGAPGGGAPGGQLAALMGRMRGGR